MPPPPAARAAAYPPQPSYPDPWDDGPARSKLSFSGIEVLHLVAGVVAISLCFYFVLQPREWPERLGLDLLKLAAAFAAVATGFVLHEFAHKVVAQRYGFWAEFRADFRMLLVSLGMAVLLPLFFAAPGAVMIQGRVSLRQHALISLVGPGVNVAMAMLAYVLWLPVSLNPGDPYPQILSIVGMVNGFLGIFNLVPLRLGHWGALDGLRVWRWNKVVWAASMVVAVAFFVWYVIDVNPLPNG